ncbi:hypothetical protein PG991_006784 [Apiospora marii]|uniref:MYND-type domain-containing protein n=1 Tax=Apiospora marii TaxID=335849 RepID=A0ABR1RYG6_9PEZI
MDIRTKREQAAERAKVMAMVTTTFNDHLPEMTPESDPELRSRCNFCEKPGKDRCGGCKSARYCSRECQVKDHPLHKLLCKSYAGFSDAQRPSADHVRAILFPASEQKPKLVWCKQKVADGKTTVYADEHIGRYRETFSVLSINRNLHLLGHADTGHGLVAFLESNSPVLGCPMNKSYTALGAPGHMMARFGDILFLGTKPDPAPEHAGKNVVLDDADLRDFRHALDCLQMHEINFAAGPPDRLATLAEQVDTVPALLIHGDGALARWTANFAGPQQAQRMQHLVTRINVPKFRGAKQGIEQDHAVGPRKLGLEWFLRCYHPDAHGFAKADLVPDTMRNDVVRHLCYVSPTFHFKRNEKNELEYPQIRDPKQGPYRPWVGSVLLFEKSGGVIHPEHVEAMNLFLDSIAHFNPRRWGRDDTTDDHPLYVNKTDHGKEAAAEAFKQFFADWKQERAARGLRVDHLLCPYAVRGGGDPGKVMAATFADKLERGFKAVDERMALVKKKKGSRGQES